MTTASPESQPAWDPEQEEASAEANPARGQRRWWVIGIVFVVVATLLTVWFGVSSTRGAVTTTDIGFERTSERQIVMIFEVTRPEGTALSCTITAMDGQYGRVGTKEQAVPAADERTTRVRAAVRTTTRAVTATVQGCTAVD
ncbi:DUF4307 domain-containing protein [Janibacter sp. G349]|uniref:DUF4307 domain-containing protein n=1 Tax=unclassified Janibacter TaxID=2649294 RepID=UPI0020CE3A97|nr:DUF4307 domain-containing protein [Janibacter sp. CX7]UTT65461.1 DUF4307 domain-containing protein [Janibacter sp. CX7]